MIVLGSRPPLTLASAGGAALGLLVLLSVLLPATLFSNPAERRVTVPRVPMLAADEVPPFGDFRGIVEKPLFNPGRAPDPLPPAEAAKSALPPLTDYRLVGLVLMKGTRLALVERKQSKQVVTLHPGDDLDGRHVDDINSEGVQLSAGAVRELLAIPRIGGISRSERKGVATPAH